MTLVRWQQSPAEFEAFRKETAREIPWIVLRFTLVVGLAFLAFWIGMRRYSPEVPLGWLTVGAGVYATIQLVFLLLLPRWHRRPGEYRLTTRGIMQSSQRGQLQSLRWWGLTGFYIEGDGRGIVLLHKRRPPCRIELPGDERDAIILGELRERLPETAAPPDDPG